MGFCIMDCVKVAKVIASKYKTKILLTVYENPNTTSNISKITKLHNSHTSKTIQELISLGLITTKTPRIKKGKIYRITPVGIEVMRQIKKMTDGS